MLPRPAHRYHQRDLTWKVEVDWDNDGFGQYDDITPYVLNGSFKASLGDGHVASVGTAKFTLGNEQRLFTPTNRMSRFYGKLKPRLPVRVTVNDGDVRPLFVGYTSLWSASNVAQGQQTANLECTDLMEVLQTHVVGVPVQENVTSDALLKIVLNDALKAPVAQATFSFSGQPSNNDTITVDGHAFKFKTALSVTPTENEVLLGATFYDTIDNTLAALNGGAGEGTTYKCPSGRSERVAAKPTQSYYHEVRSDGPVRWYRLGEPSGATAADSGLNGRDATYVNSPTLGNAGALAPDTAVSFDGANDYVSIPSINVANRSYSVEAWIACSATPPTAQAIFGMFDSYAAGKSMYLQVRSDGSVYHTNYFDDLQSSTTPITFDGTPFHVALTINGDGTQRILYVNGVNVGQNTGGVFTDTNPACYIGADETGPLHFFKGVIDELAVYDYALTPAQVASHYSAGGAYASTVSADAPIRYYRLGEQTGTTAFDIGSEAQNGTHTGTTLGADGLIPSATGDPDECVVLNGVDEYISVPYLSLDNRPFSVEFWMKPGATPPASQIPFSVGSVSAAGERFFFYLESDGKLTLSFFSDDLVSGAGAIAFDNSWYHVVGTYDYAGDTACLYINGALVGTNNAGALTVTDPVMYIGAFNPSSELFKGSLDEVAIYWQTLPASEISGHYAARVVAPGIVVSALVRGTAGNGIPMSESASNVTVSGDTAGGSDLPAGASIETGRDTFDIAGDQWDAERTNAMSCIQDIAESERAFFWIGRDGLPVYKNRDWLFKRASAAPVTTLVGEPRLMPVVSADSVQTVVKVSVTPRSVLTSGVVAKADNRVTVNGTGQKNNDGSWTRFNPLEDPKVGVTTLTLQFVDQGTGKISGAKNLVIPLEPYTDYTAWDFPDETGFDYTDNDVLSFGVMRKSTGVELDVHNSALGPLYLFGLQVRGQAIVAYDSVTKEARDADAIALYGTRTLSLSLPLASSEVLADAVAHYLLTRYKDPTPRITQFSLGSQRETAGGLSLFAIGIGDVVYLSDSVLGVTDRKHLITGYDIQWEPGQGRSGRVQTTFDVMELDDVTYATLDDANYGILDLSTRFAI